MYSDILLELGVIVSRNNGVVFGSGMKFLWIILVFIMIIIMEVRFWYGKGMGKIYIVVFCGNLNN